MPATTVKITDAQKEQYVEEGYFVLEGAVPDEHLALLREHCDRFVEQREQEMAVRQSDKEGISHRGKRYFIGNQSREHPALFKYLFSDLLADVCRATIGPEAYLFCEQFVVKQPKTDSPFSWHQDSGYVGHEHPPYVTCWTAIDAVDESNGTVYVLPYSRAGTRQIIRHEADAESNDLVGYHGDDPGIPVVAPAGSLAVFSSRTFHRSGPNETDRPRRAYVPQFSPEPIRSADGSRQWNLADPFLEGGRIVATTRG